VDRSSGPGDRSIVIAYVDHVFTVGYIVRDGETFCLAPADKHASSVPLTSDANVKIFGVVTAVIHEFKK